MNNNCPQCGNPIPMGSNTCQLCGYVMPDPNYYNDANTQGNQVYNEAYQYGNAGQVNTGAVYVEPVKKKSTSPIWFSIIGTIVVIVGGILIFWFSTHHLSCKVGGQRTILFYSDDHIYFCITWPFGKCKPLDVYNQTAQSFESFDQYIQAQVSATNAAGGKCSVK